MSKTLEQLFNKARNNGESNKNGRMSFFGPGYVDKDNCKNSGTLSTTVHILNYGTGGLQF